MDRAATEKKSFTEWLTVGKGGFQLSDIEDSRNPDTLTMSHSKGEYDPTDKGNQPNPLPNPQQNPPPHILNDADIPMLAGHIAQGDFNVAAALHGSTNPMGMETRPRTTGRGHSLGLINEVVWHELKVADFNLHYRRYPQNNLAGRQDNVGDQGGQDKRRSPSGGEDCIKGVDCGTISG